MTEAGIPDADSQPATCPWCAATVAGAAATCAACGAAVAQRESIGGLKIAGLTSVDPALEDFDKRPLQLRGPSPTQGIAPALIIGAVAGGPIGLVAIGGVAAVAGAEFLGAGRSGSGGTALEDVGRPSEVLLQALDNAELASADPPPTGDAVPGAQAAQSGRAHGASDTGEPEGRNGPDHAARDDGRSIWRDLPTTDEAS